MKLSFSSQVKIILPAYNEAGALKAVVQDLYEVFRRAGFQQIELIVVDDGSRDQTGEIAQSLQKSYPLTLLRHPINRGLGAALKTGMYYAAYASLPEDIILTTESDGTQPAHKLVELAQRIHEGAEFAVATPLEKSDFAGVPFYRRFLSHGVNLLYGFLFPMEGLKGYTNLSRGFRASLLQRALNVYGPERFIDQTGFEAVPDIALKLRRLHPKTAQIRITIDHQKMKRRSSIPIYRTIKLSLLLCLRHLTTNLGLKNNRNIAI